jgi:hypothetical protein
VAEPADIKERLQAIADELADLALDRLSRALAEGATTPPDAERRLTRARRAVEKAVALLSDDETGRID